MSTAQQSVERSENMATENDLPFLRRIPDDVESSNETEVILRKISTFY